MLQRKTARYGWKRDTPDWRDRHFSITERVPLPTVTDLRGTGFLPPVYDQEACGSCTANAIAAAIDFERAYQKLPFLNPSRLFIYYCERSIEGDPDQDAGAEIRDGIKSVNAQGVCPESEWPYDISKFAVKPPEQCYTDATGHKTLQYARLDQSAYDMKHCLAILGRPFVFGFSVYESFESDVVAKSGVVNLPDKSERLLGGHAVLCVGYDDTASRFLVRNSWGTGFGMAGCFTIPYDYLLSPDLASDFWTIQLEQ